MEDDQHALGRMAKIKREDGDANGAHSDAEQAASTLTPNARDEHSRSPADASLEVIKSRSESTEAPATAKPARLSRKASQRIMAREAPLYDHLPAVTDDSCKLFQVIPDCLYGSKHLGASDNDALDCECREDWIDGENHACGDDSCINRATKMECSADADNCGGGCQNQRFQRKQYARVSVIKTEKKGFGLRADADLQPNDFVYEYIGEVINEPTFRRRMMQYDEDGIKHFYFMSLHKGEFVDATKKGNLGRFCNHSCNPNCYVDKWVVGDKFRMGIFALRPIRAGEELVFNYNVDRYGADPQPCYCGEPNCVGFIGGKTQTERSTKLPTAIIEALGIDYADGWDTSVAKKPRKKRPDEDDEEYVASIQARGLDEEDARKVMAALVQCKEKWIAVKLLERIEQCDEERVIHCVMRMHAYQILKTTLNTFIGDHNVVLQVLSILDKFPRLTRNKIQDSHIDTTVEGLANSEHEDVASKSQKLLDEWSKLEVAYRIRRRKADPTAPASAAPEDKKTVNVREEERSQPSPRTASPRQIDAPKGPRNSVPQRNNAFFHNGPRQRRPPFNAPLPKGWFAAKDARGNTYFYDKQGTTTWKRPAQPAAEPAQKAPSKAIQEQLLIQSIIAKVTKEGTPKQPAPQASQSVEPPANEPKKEKWRTLSVEKQMKLYENTVFPPVKYVLDKFRNKLPKDELKRLGKEIAKKLVASDFKNNRVEDPTAALSEKQVHKIKKYVNDFLDRAVEKYQEHQKRRDFKGNEPGPSGGKGRDSGAKSTAGPATDTPTDSPPRNGDVAMADAGDNISPSDAGREVSPAESDLKRKRASEPAEPEALTPSDGPEAKRLKEDTDEATPPPPPPPPPMDSPMDDAMTAEEQALREQEEALERENEEAQRLEDEARTTKQLQETAASIEKDIAAAKDQTLTGMGDKEAVNAQSQRANGQTPPVTRDEANGDSGEINEQNRTRKQEVLGH